MRAGVEPATTDSLVGDVEFLTRAFMEAESREQRRLAQLLHDQLSQQLLGAAFGAKLLANQVDRGDTPSAAEMHDLARMLNECAGQLREVTADPGIRAAEQGDLVTALRELAKLQRRAEVQVTGDEPEAVDTGRSTPVAYRLILDAVLYAIAAAASRIAISCLSNEGFVAIQISSNEPGDSELWGSADGFARKLYGYRCRAIGASVQFTENNDCGKTITLSIPVPL